MGLARMQQSVFSKPQAQVSSETDIASDLPDILALSSAEVQLPTLNMSSSELGDISLSGLINTIIAPEQGDQVHQQIQNVVQVDPNTIQGQNQSITFHLQPMEPDQAGPIRDVRDNIQGFNNGGQQQWDQDIQSILEPKPQPDQKPFVRILEQPASHKLRFRYKCEGRGAGALQGERSSSDKKTFPKIQIVGYKGPAVVVVSCVTHDGETSPKAHPHNLVSPASVGRDGCKKGVCTMNVNSEDMTVEFPHLGIQCVRKKDIAEALKLRQEIRVDPFRQGFGHVDSPNSIDLNAVKLCFQVFLENPKTPGKYTVILDPVISKPIFDAKAKKELQIMDMSDNTAPADGGKKIIILCEKVSKEDIKVRFFDYNGWEEWADFGSSGVHKQYAISLSAPRYCNVNISEPVRVCVELVKPSDDSRSEEEEFFYTPITNSNMTSLNIASPSAAMANPPNVSDSDLVKILGGIDGDDSEMQNLSDKLGDFNLGSSMTSSPVEAGPGGSRVGGKRSSREAENDSASMLIPRQMERQQSSIQTPNVSSNLSEILQNCKQINDL